MKQRAVIAPGARATRVKGSSAVGERVRARRIETGLTQAELGGERFSKEYVSQVELGKTRPSAAALEWFVQRLGVDALELAGESSGAVRAACEAAVARAEAAIEAHRYAEALDGLSGTQASLAAAGDTRLEVRHMLTHAWAAHHVGLLEEALEELARAGDLADDLPDGGDVRALALFRMGVVRFKMGSLATAASLLDESLRTADACEARRMRCARASSTGGPRCAAARRTSRRRRRTWRRRSSWPTRLNDERVMAETYLDASLVAERRNEYSLAREYAERSKVLFERVSDQEYVGKLLNNLGQLHAITGKAEQAVPLLRESFRIAVDLDNRIDAAFAASSLASARMHTGDLEGAIESANRAIELLRNRGRIQRRRRECPDGHGQSTAVARPCFDEAEQAFRAAAKCFEAVETVSHMAGAWVALGDVATRRGETGSAADHYRRAAEALQDVRW